MQSLLDNIIRDFEPEYSLITKKIISDSCLWNSQKRTKSESISSMLKVKKFNIVQIKECWRWLTLSKILSKANDTKKTLKGSSLVFANFWG